MSPAVFFFFLIDPWTSSILPQRAAVQPGAGWLLPVYLACFADYPQDAWALWLAPGASEQSPSTGVLIFGCGFPL